MSIIEGRRTILKNIIISFLYYFVWLITNIIITFLTKDSPSSKAYGMLSSWWAALYFCQFASVRIKYIWYFIPFGIGYYWFFVQSGLDFSTPTLVSGLLFLLSPIIANLVFVSIKKYIQQRCIIKRILHESENE